MRIWPFAKPSKEKYEKAILQHKQKQQSITASKKFYVDFPRKTTIFLTFCSPFYFSIVYSKLALVDSPLYTILSVIIMICAWILIFLVAYFSSKYISARITLRYDRKIQDVDSKLAAIIDEIKSNLPYNEVQQIIERFELKNTMQNINQNLSKIKNSNLSTHESKDIDEIAVHNETENSDLNHIHLPYIPNSHKRSICERFIDAFFSDGPNNKYALICHKCAGHNGLSMPQDLKFKKFRCVYCNSMNDFCAQNIDEMPIQINGIEPLKISKTELNGNSKILFETNSNEDLNKNQEDF